MDMTVGASLLEVHTSWSWIMIVGNAMAGAWAVCSSDGSSRAGVTVVSRAHTTACPHATAGRRPENCII